MRDLFFEHLSSYVLSMYAGKVKTATKYLLPNMTVRINQDKFASKGRHPRVRVTVSVGRPNYAEQKFIKLCQKAGEKFPVKKVQLKSFPTPRGKKDRKSRRAR